jgi:hypothetical protein
MTYVFKCSDCGKEVKHTPEEGYEDIYAVAYIAGARHERFDPDNRRADGFWCLTAGAKCLVLQGLEVDY